MKKTLLLAILFTVVLGCSDKTCSMNIYWIDVERGASTLIVTTPRKAVLMDTGYQTDDPRDTKRILAAMEYAEISKVDVFYYPLFEL